MFRFTILVVAVCVLAVPSTFAKGGGSYSPGTGSKAASSHVKGYYKKDGTYVEPYKRSTPDAEFENNWTTKGNINLNTGKLGTRVTEPSRK
jgi:hypothetical protein